MTADERKDSAPKPREGDTLSGEQAIRALERQLRLMRRKHNEEFDALKAELESLKQRHAVQS